LGVPFFLVGAFAVELPKSGRWMIHVKSLLAIVLAVVALYYLNVAFPILGGWVTPGPLLYGITAVVIPVGVLLGAIHRDFASPLLEDKFLKSLGASSVTVAAFALVVAGATPERSLKWQPLALSDARTTAQEEGRPLLVDFTAAWCGACKEFDNVTFADPEVSREAGRFVAVKIDATDDEDPLVVTAMREVGVRGLPTVVVFSSDGREATRFTDFVGPDEFLAALRPVR
jgi:thiol:disulfide interchange protein DsbD